MRAPIAKRIPHPHRLHGDVREDDYYWLKDRSNPEVIQYLEDENKYYDQVMEPLAALTEDIFQGMVDRVPDSEVNVPIKRGPYFYYARLDKSKQYPIYARKQADTRGQLVDAQEEVVLDLNQMVDA